MLNTTVDNLEAIVIIIVLILTCCLLMRMLIAFEPAILRITSTNLNSPGEFGLCISSYLPRRFYAKSVFQETKLSRAKGP